MKKAKEIVVTCMAVGQGLGNLVEFYNEDGE